jgi:hypothetical protein
MIRFTDGVLDCLSLRQRIIIMGMLALLNSGSLVVVVFYCISLSSDTALLHEDLIKLLSRFFDMAFNKYFLRIMFLVVGIGNIFFVIFTFSVSHPQTGNDPHNC